MTSLSLRIVCGLFLVLGLLNGCGSSSSTTAAAPSASNPLAVAAAATAITSPTASGTAATASLWGGFQKASSAFLQFSGLRFLANYFGLAQGTAHANETTAPADVKPYSEMKAEAATALTGTPAAAAALVGSFEPVEYDAKCFNATHNVSGQAGTVNILYGDGGVAYATASATDANACMAGYMNALVGGQPFYANKLLKLQATMLTAAKDAGASLPAVGDESDFLTNMPAITGLTLTTAKLARLADDAAGLKIYRSTFGFTSATSSKTGTATIWHTPKNADNTNYKGLLQAVLPHTPAVGGSGAHRGLSMIYDMTDGTFTFILKHGANQATDSTTFFNTTTGEVNYNATGISEDLIKIVGKFVDSTGAATLWAAWQAGSNDGASRITNVTISGRENGSTGTGYFGYGNALNDASSTVGGNLTDSTAAPWIEGMFCAWLTNLSNGTLTTKAQKQTFTYNSTTGKWAVTANNWQFARRPDCTTNATWTVTSHPITEVNTTYAALATSELASLPTTEIPSITLPTFTKP